jgi:hypothetical protein
MIIKKFLCMAVFSIIEIGVPLLLALSGIGYEHWQWWMVLFGIVSAYFVGLAVGGIE